MNPANLDAQLSRIAEVVVVPRVRIFLLVRAFDWNCWLCEACLEIWRLRGWAVRSSKDGPHPLTCDECGHVDAQQQEPAKAA